MIKVVVFDLDDTLYEEVDYCRSGFAAISRFIAESREGVTAESVFEAFWKQFNSGDRRRIFNNALDELGISYDEEYILSLVKEYRGHKPDISLPDENREVLEELGGEYKLALLSDGFMPGQRLKTQALDVEKYFECIIYTEELGREFWKPSPVGFEKILDFFGVKAESMVYIGDNAQKDFIAPNRLGAISIQLVRACGVHKEASEVPDSAAQHVINSLGELAKLLKELNQA